MCKRSLSVFLLSAALIAGLVSCQPTPVLQYDLTISSTTGGDVSVPGEGTFSYDEGTVVNLTAEAEEGYEFVSWAGDVTTIADVNTATTTITMNGNYSITASFQIYEVPVITFAVTGPMALTQGMDHWAGAEMARDEINASGGVDVGGVRHDTQLVKVETDEILDVSGVSGTMALSAVIDDVDFIVGGFRTPTLAVYREVAVGPSGAGKIFVNCGAAMGVLQMSVVTDYDNYKYWFKAIPYNEVFLVTSCFKYCALVNNVLRAALADARNTHNIPPHGTEWTAADVEPTKFAILIEDLEWSNPMEVPTIRTLTGLGLTYVGTWKCESTATDLDAQLTAINTANPHIVFTIFSGPPGKAYGAQQSAFAPNVFSLGINVQMQDINYHRDTGAEYHMTLDTWAEGCVNTPTTVSWFDAFVARTGRWPSYLAGTYDAIHAVVEAVEAVSAANGSDDIGEVIDHANVDALIEYLETTPRVGVGANTAYYPMPELGPFDPIPGTHLTTTFWALSADQALALYPDLPAFYGLTEEQLKAAWIPDDIFLQWTTVDGHIAHDTVYGPGYQTGIGTQWQEIDGTWKKVAVWPMYLGPEYDAALTDRYGNWNFQYPGTKPLKVPDEWIAAWLTPP